MYKPSNVCASACTTTSCSFCECKQSPALTHTQKRAYTDKRVHQSPSTLTSFTLRLLLLLPPSTLLLAVHTYWVSVSSSQPVRKFQTHRKFRKVQQQPPQPLKQQQRQRKRQRFVEPVAASACACALCLVPGQLLPKTKAKHTWSSSRGKCPLLSSHLIFPFSFWESRQLFLLHALLPNNCYHFCDEYTGGGWSQGFNLLCT